MSIFKDNEYEKEKAEKEIIQKHEKEREQQIISRYKEDILNNQKMIKPFTEIITEIIGNDTCEEFMDKTGLSKDMYYNIQKQTAKNKPHKKSTIVSVCVGYDAGIQIAVELLQSQGSHFNPHSKIDSAYILLLTECRGKSVDECNELLETIEINKADRLGVCARQPYKRKKKA